MLCSVCYKGYLFGWTTTMTAEHLIETVRSFLILHHKKSRAASCWRVLGGKKQHSGSSGFDKFQIKIYMIEFTRKVRKNLKWIEKNSQKQPSNIYWMIIIVNHLLIWLFSQASSGCHLVESAANGEYYFVSLLKLAIFRDQGHIREVVAVRDASQRNLSTITIPPPRQAFMLSTKFSPDHLLVHILVHQSDPLNLAPVSSPSSHLLSSSLGPCGARQVNARACLRGHPSRIVDERLRIDWWEACFHSYCQNFATKDKITQDCLLFPFPACRFWFYCSSILVNGPTRARSKKSLPFESICMEILKDIF